LLKETKANEQQKQQQQQQKKHSSSNNNNNNNRKLNPERLMTVTILFASKNLSHLFLSRNHIIVFLVVTIIGFSCTKIPVLTVFLE